MKFANRNLTKILAVLLSILGSGAAALFGQSASTVPSTAVALRATPGKFAPDINPDSLNRLPPIQREELSDARKKRYDAMNSGPGHFSWMPAAAEILLHGGGEDVRYESPLGHRFTELAIIATAREMDQPFEWTLHAEEALRQGVERSIVDIVRDRKPLAGLGEKETVIIELGRETVGKHKLTSETFARALKVLGEKDLVDIVSLQGHYVGSAVRLSMVDQHLPVTWKFVVPLPLPFAEVPSPPDVHPDSRSRLPLITRGQPSNDTKRPSLAPPGTGPTQIGLHAGNTKLLEADIGKLLVDVAVLVTAREWNQQYLWTMCEVEALKDGLAPELIDIIRNGKTTAGSGEKEAAIIEAGREEFERHHVSSETYARALKQFGERDLVDLAGLMADQGEAAAILTAFDQQLPPGQKPLLPSK